jgi:hypothetical protein
MIVLGDAMLRINRKAIIALAAYNKLPAIYGPRDYDRLWRMYPL